MIKRICASLILVCLFIAIGLAAFGIKRVDIGPAFLSFMNRVSHDMEGWKVEIPNIPLLEKWEGEEDILKALADFLNFFVNIINILILLINTIINVIQFILTLIWDLRLLIENLKVLGDPNYIWPLT